MEILRALRDCPGGFEMLPGSVRATLAHGGPGYTQAPAAGPRPPDGLPGKVAANKTFIMGVLYKMQISPPEPADDDDNVRKLEAAE